MTYAQAIQEAQKQERLAADWLKTSEQMTYPQDIAHCDSKAIEAYRAMEAAYATAKLISKGWK